MCIDFFKITMKCKNGMLPLCAVQEIPKFTIFLFLLQLFPN